jgi:hypothetical protein
MAGLTNLKLLTDFFNKIDPYATSAAERTAARMFGKQVAQSSVG